jgi:hypothetical protein
VTASEFLVRLAERFEHPGDSGILDGWTDADLAHECREHAFIAMNQEAGLIPIEPEPETLHETVHEPSAE